MPSIKVYNMKGQETGSMELSEIFAIEYNEPLIHQAVVTRLANERQGTKSSLTRSEVRGGGKKPYRQKGTGSARQGSTRAPQWTKGGVVFAPKSRDFSKKMNVTAKRVALFSALSSKVNAGEMVVVDNITATEYKTANMVEMLKALGAAKKTLIVLSEVNGFVIKSCDNIPGVKTTQWNTINVYDILNCDSFVVAKDAVAKIEEVYAR